MTEVRETKATVKWKKPKDTGGQDLKGYVLEKMDTDSGRWVPAGEVTRPGDNGGQGLQDLQLFLVSLAPDDKRQTHSDDVPDYLTCS